MSTDVRFCEICQSQLRPDLGDTGRYLCRRCAVRAAQPCDPGNAVLWWVLGVIVVAIVGGLIVLVSNLG